METVSRCVVTPQPSAFAAPLGANHVSLANPQSEQSHSFCRVSLCSVQRPQVAQKKAFLASLAIHTIPPRKKPTPIESRIRVGRVAGSQINPTSL